MGSTMYNDISKLRLGDELKYELSKFVYLDVLKKGSLTEICDVIGGILDGQKTGYIGELEMIGTSQKFCNPVYNNTNLSVNQKEWDLGDFTIAEELCADDFKNTVFRYAMNRGTAISDLTNTAIVRDVLSKVLSVAIEKGIWRVAFFGHKSARNVSDGGIITDGLDPKFFTITDGLFHRLFDLVTQNSSQHIPIEANALESHIEQRNAMRKTGVASSILDDLIYNADPILRQSNDAQIVCTQSMADALAFDLKSANIGSSQQWESLFGGLMSANVYNGVKIVAVPMWDAMISANEKTGDALNKPHRAIFTTKSNLMIGTDSNSHIPDLDVFFDRNTKTNKIDGRLQIGTQIGDDRLINFAY